MQSQRPPPFLTQLVFANHCSTVDLKPWRERCTTHQIGMNENAVVVLGTRGKFYHPGAKLNLPVYLNDQVQIWLAALANAKGIDFSALVNDLLKKDIELIEMAR